MNRPLRLVLISLAAPACLAAQEVVLEDVPRAVPVEPERLEDVLAAMADESPAGPVFGDRVLSRSGQFRVRDGDAALRGTVAILAEEIRDRLLRLTGETDEEWKVPVHIQLVGEPGELPPPRSVAKALTYGEEGYDLRMRVHVGRGLDVERFENAIIAAIIYERGLRGLPPGQADTPLLVPPWVVDGLREANAWRLGGGERRLYEALFRTGGLFKLDDLFGTSEGAHDSLDAASRAAFRVSSGALVMALLEQPDGTAGFRKFLDEVAPFDGEMPALLRRHFPDLNLSESSLAKWWALQLAAKGAARLTESLTVAETENALADALVLRLRDEENGGLLEIPAASWREVADLDAAERLAGVRMAEDALVRLSYRCFPSYRPLLVEYQDALGRIARNENTDNLDALLDDLAESRAIMTARSERARDYLDWFEITRARHTSGAFDDYLLLKERLATPASTRTDPVTNVLDRFDRIFFREHPGPRRFTPDFAPDFAPDFLPPFDDAWSAYPNLPRR